MKKSLLYILPVISFAAYFAVKACIFSMDPDDARVIFFPPELADTTMREFYYSPHLIGSGSYEKNIASDLDTNVSEWQAYTHSQATREDIEALVYHQDTSALQAYYNKLLKGKSVKKDGIYLGNSFARYLSDKKDIAVFEYLLYARSCESDNFYSHDNWVRYNADSSHALMTVVIEKGLGKYKKTNSEMLKLRYAFQLVRLAQYAGRDDRAVEFYNTLAEPNAFNSVIRYWAMDYKRLAHWDRNEAAYLASVVYDKAPGKREVSQNAFRSLTARGITDSMVGYCRNDHEKSVFFCLAGLTRYGEEGWSYLEKATKLDPSAQKTFEIILCREINKLEDEFSTPDLYREPQSYTFWGNYYDNTSIDSTAGKYEDAKKLLAFVAGYAASKEVQRPAFWYIAASYIAMMTEDYKGANEYLEKAAGYNAPELEMQRKLTAILISLNHKKVIDAEYEGMMAPVLRWMRNHEKEIGPKRLYDIYRIFAKKYSRQKDLTKALLCYSKYRVLDSFTYDYDFERQALFGSMQMDFEFETDYECSATDLVHLYSILNSRNKSSIEKILCEGFPFPDKELTRYIGMHYMRDIDFKNAYYWFKLSGDSLYSTGEDPFSTIDKNTNNDTTIKLTDSRYYIEVDNPVTFSKKMIELEQKMKSDPKNAAKYYFQYANGLYNITYWGNSWNFIRLDWSTNGPYIFNENKKRNKYVFQDNYYLCKVAIEYYMKAWNASKDNEMASECVFQLAKCAQKVQYVTEESSGYSSIIHPAWQNPYFDIIKKRYSSTKYIRRTKTECSYMGDFLAKK